MGSPHDKPGVNKIGGRFRLQLGTLRMRRGKTRTLGVFKMLREIRDVQQIPGEKPRRWFFSHEADLLVWFGEDNVPAAFQLAYGKYRDEHAIRWKTGVGFAHYKVDTGLDGRELPLLVADGPFPAAKIINQFQKLAVEVPADIVAFVCERLREHPEFREDT